jgi:hypothetical protein
MKKEMNYEEISREIRNNLVGILAGIGVEERKIFWILCMLPKATQRYDLTDWIVNQIDTGKPPSPDEILEQALLLRE